MEQREHIRKTEQGKVQVGRGGEDGQEERGAKGSVRTRKDEGRVGKRAEREDTRRIKRKR